ncbi:MAG: hypothetical protein ACLQUY_02110 [Ktedonobacterales bacterium]
MQLSFDLGDPQAPRGHAIVYAHAGNDPNQVLATYCVVLPIQFSIGKFLPPMLAGQLSLEGLHDPQAMSVVPIPPILEDAPPLAQLRQLAERRGDDLCDIGTIFISDDGQRMTYAAEACQSYAQLFAEYSQHWPVVAAVSPPSEGTPLDDLNIEEVLAGVLSERDRLAELARMVGQLGYARDGHDQRLEHEVTESMRRLARTLPEKYRANQLVDAVIGSDAHSSRLAELYIQRAYKLADEEYADIPAIDSEIRALHDGEQGTGN